jgi:hypothetical protein
VDNGFGRLPCHIGKWVIWCAPGALTAELFYVGFRLSPDNWSPTSLMSAPLRHGGLLSLLALEADPVVLASDMRAQLRRHHRYPADGADRWAVVVGPAARSL